jgi:hypothetical protein
MELKRDDIIKALEHCFGNEPCSKCEWHEKGNGCLSKLAQSALSLIKELTEENERLKADKDYWKNRAKESESEYAQAVKRGYNLGAIDYVGSFAERLKAETITIQDHTGKLGSVVLVGTIDQIAKEMLEAE